MKNNDLQISFLFEVLLVIILIVKILFISSIVLKFKAIADHDETLVKRYTEYHDMSHKSFTFLMGILLIIVFDPHKYPTTVCVSGHTKIYIYLFGLLSIIGVLHDYYTTHIFKNKTTVSVGYSKNDTKN